MHIKISVITLLAIPLFCMQIDCQENDNDTNCEGLAVYNLTFEGKWSEDVFYRQYPLFRPNAQWSKVLGRTHSDEYVLWRFDTTASSGMKKFAELGSSEEYDKTEKQGGGGILDIFQVDPVTFGVGKTSALFFADVDHHLLSTATKIVPSPDWFVGVDSLNLCSNGQWLELETVELYPVDAGTDKGFTFTAPNWVEVPFKPIYQITSQFPSHPANSFYYREKDHLPPMAALHIKLLDWYRKTDAVDVENQEEETEIKKVKGMFTTPFESESVSNVIEDGAEKLDAFLKMVKSAFDNAKIIDDENRRDIVIKIPSERKRRRNRNRRRKLRLSSKEGKTKNADHNIINPHTHKHTHQESDLLELNNNRYMTSSTSNNRQEIPIKSIANNKEDVHNKVILKKLQNPTMSVEVDTPTDHDTQPISNTVKSAPTESKIETDHSTQPTSNIVKFTPTESKIKTDHHTQPTSNTVKSAPTESKIKTVKIDKLKAEKKKIEMDLHTDMSSALNTGDEFLKENVYPTGEYFPNEYNTDNNRDVHYKPHELFNTEPPPAKLRRIWDSMFPTTTQTVLNDFIHDRNSFVERIVENTAETSSDIGEQNEASINWQPINCVLSDEWAQWSPCSKSCGYGTRSRVKLIASPAQNGGRNCDQEPVLELCGTMRTCSQWRHFSFENWGMGSNDGDHLKLKEKDKV